MKVRARLARVWTVSGLGCILLPASLAAQDAGERSSRSGVYTIDQARQGQEIYAGRCRSCHTQAAHIGTFKGAWGGHRLAEPFQYIFENMPKDSPGSLSRDETVAVLAYFLELIGTPAGTDSLAGDSVGLARIRIDTLVTQSHAAEEKKP